jgi:hypothetical protein
MSKSKQKFYVYKKDLENYLDDDFLELWSSVEDMDSDDLVDLRILQVELNIVAEGKAIRSFQSVTKGKKNVKK